MKALLLSSLLLAAPAQAETMTAASPCLPATLPPSADLDVDATMNKATPPPVSFDIYKDLALRGSFYGEAVVATVTVDPQNGTVEGVPKDPTASETAPGCD